MQEKETKHQETVKLHRHQNMIIRVTKVAETRENVIMVTFQIHNKDSFYFITQIKINQR
jgi:hypothetical protein